MALKNLIISASFISVLIGSCFCFSPTLHAEEGVSGTAVIEAQHLIQKGWEMGKTANYKEATKLFKQALELYPDNPRAVEGLARISAASKQYSMAISYYEWLLELEPHNVNAMLEEADLLIKLAHYSEAKKLLEHAHNIAPDREDITALLGLANKWVDGMDHQITQLQREVALDVNNVEKYVSLGRTYLWTGELDSAQRVYEHALEHNPNNPLIMYNLGLIYEETGDWHNARKYFKETLRVNPHFIEAETALSDLKLLYRPRVTARYHINRFGRYDKWLGFTGSIVRDDTVTVEYTQPIRPNLEIEGGYSFTISREIDRLTDVRQYFLYLHNPFLQVSATLPYDISIVAKYNFVSYQKGKKSTYELPSTQNRHGGFFLLSKYIWHNNISFQFNRYFYTNPDFFDVNFVRVEAGNNYTLSDEIFIGRHLSCLLAYNMNHSSNRTTGLNSDVTFQPRLSFPFYEPLSIEYMFNYADKPTRYIHMGAIAFENHISDWLEFELRAQVTRYTLDSSNEYAGLFTIDITPLKRLFFTLEGMFSYHEKNLTHDYMISATVIF